MSQPAPERPTSSPQSAPKPSGGNFLTRKYGPLPGWGWAAAAAAVAGGYIWYRRRHAATSTTAGTTTATTSATTTSTDYAGEISTLQAEIQQLQGSLSTSAATTTATSTGTGTSTGTTSPARPKYKAVTASGKESLNKIAKANHTSAAAVADFTLTNKTHIGAELKKYLNAANYQARMPKGLIVWVPQ